jgi:hypothetical protein
MYTPEQRNAIYDLGKHLHDQSYAMYKRADYRKTGDANALYDLAEELFGIVGHEIVSARIPTTLVPRHFTETAAHFQSVTKPVDWPLDEPDVD